MDDAPKRTDTECRFRMVFRCRPNVQYSQPASVCWLTFYGEPSTYYTDPVRRLPSSAHAVRYRGMTLDQQYARQYAYWGVRLGMDAADPVIEASETYTARALCVWRPLPSLICAPERCGFRQYACAPGLDRSR